MSTNRPARHRYLAIHGDVNPSEYGGGYVVRVSPDGQSSYVSIYVVEWDSDADDSPGYLYEGDLRDRDIAAVHSWADIAAILRSQGNPDGPTVDEWRKLARGTILERARCLVDIAGYYGWHEIDSYPIRVTRDDIRKRWARVGVGRKGGFYSFPGV